MTLSDRYPQRRAFVTGAASGLGLAFCRQLAADHWTIGMADADGAGLETAAAAIRRRGGTPLPVMFDVTDAGSFKEAADDFVAESGGVDLVINNAGIGAGGPFEEATLADWHAVLDVNLMGVVHGCRAFVPHLKRRGGHLMNVSSLAALASSPRMALYNTSKAAVKSLSETLYGELRGAGIHVCVVMPPFFRTQIHTRMRGGPIDRTVTRILTERAELTAEEVAEHALREAARGRINVIYPTWEALLVWYGKRLFPESFVKGLVKRARELEEVVRRISQEVETPVSAEKR